MQLTAPTMYGTQATSTTGPTPSGYPDYPIGTGRASGTGAVGTTISRGDDNKYTGSTTVTQIDKITSMPANPNQQYPDTIAGWIESVLDYALDPDVEFNPVTGTYRARGPGGAIGSFAALTGLGGLAGVFGEMNVANLTDIAAKAYEGAEGYAVGMLDGQVIGVGPGLFGGAALSGNLPPDLTPQQRDQIIDQLLSLENRSGAYTPGTDPSRTTGGAFSFNTAQTSPIPAMSYSAAGYGTGTFSSGTYESGAGYAAFSGSAASSPTAVDLSYSRGYYDEDMNTPSDNNDGNNGGGSFGSGGDSGQDPGAAALGDDAAMGGRIGMSWGGSTDDASDDDMGDVATMESSYSPDPDAFSDEDAGGYDSPGSDGFSSGPSSSFGPTMGRIQSNLVSAIQNRPMSPEERYASNAMLAKSGMTIKDIQNSLSLTDWESAWKEAAKIDTLKPFNESEAKGFTSIGDAISQGLGALTQGALMGLGFREGGEVTQGFVNKDPNTVSDAASIADNRHTSVKAGSFVVNQPTNEKHKEKLDKIVADASKVAKMKKGGKAEMVDVALSDGERLIEPEVVAQIEKKYGKNFLDNLNDEGKPEVKRRQAKYGEKVGAADGGFLAEQGMELGDVGENIPYEEYLPVSDELVSQLSKFSKRKPQRGQIKEFIKSLSPEDKLTVLYLTETQSTTDPIESMEAIGEVVKNRMESDYYDFKDLKTLDDVLLKQTRKGAFHFSGLEPSTLHARAKEVAKGVADQGLRKAAAAAQNTLDPETEGTRRLPAGTVFYTRKDAPSQWMRESKDLEYSTELGGHEFYRTFQRKEFP
jgi:hypothetical protein